MTDDLTAFIVPVLILSLIWVNHRREIWKHRAKLLETVIKAKDNQLQAERDANVQLCKELDRGFLYKPTGNDWPEEFE